MVQKLSLYDFLANLIPGLAFLGALSWLGQFLHYPRIIPIADSIGETSVLLAWAYIVGLLIQGIAQGVVEKIVLAMTGGFPSARWLLDNEYGFSPDYKTRLKKAIGEYFQISVEPKLPDNLSRKAAKKAKLSRYQELFYLCYNLVDQKKLSDRPLAFNAHYGLFRALFTLSLILLLLFISVTIWKWEYISQQGATSLFYTAIVFLISASLISYYRMRKRGEDFARSIYDLFLTFHAEEEGGRS
ncbi:MAG: hypothetical protein ACE5GH_03390 [Fidelibacterota bacterium]